jgi:hypothetical protein
MVSMTITAMVKHSSCPAKMDESPPKAIDVAVAVYKQPNQFMVPKPGSYPLDMLDVIKTAAGDEETIELMAKDLNMARDTVVQVCKFYLHKLLTAGGNDPFRMLALDYGATVTNIKDHKRWLLKWLHPDRNPSKWESALFLTIGKAALVLEQGSNVQEMPTNSATAACRRRSSRQTVWKYSKVKKRKLSTLKLLKPFMLALSMGLIVLLVVTSAISNWLLIMQVM